MTQELPSQANGMRILFRDRLPSDLVATHPFSAVPLSECIEIRSNGAHE